MAEPKIDHVKLFLDAGHPKTAKVLAFARLLPWAAIPASLPQIIKAVEPLVQAFAQ